MKDDRSSHVSSFDTGGIRSRELPSFNLRRGVWSLVTSPIAGDALMAILSAFDLAQRWGGYGEEEDCVRRAVIKGLLELNHGPDASWIATRTRLGEGQVSTLLGRLAARDLIVRDNGGAIVGAYPLATKPTDHCVGVGGRIVQAMCAIDALGIGAMLGTDVIVDSRCRACAAPIQIETGSCGTGLHRVEPPSIQVWSGIRYEGGCAANSLCTVIAFFCSEAHQEEWQSANHPDIEGYRLTVEEAMQIGRALFAPVFANADDAVGRAA